MSVVANSPGAWSVRASEAAPWDAAMWSEHGQTERFRAVLRHLELQPGDSLLDFGCGPGRLCEMLPPHVGYYAHDWADGMLDRVEREQPRAEILPELPPRLFDHVACVGTFNLADGWWKQRTWDTLSSLWADHVRASLIVSLYRGDDPACLRYTDLDAITFVRRVGCVRYLVDLSYLDNDLTLVMHR